MCVLVCARAFKAYGQGYGFVCVGVCVCWCVCVCVCLHAYTHTHILAAYGPGYVCVCVCIDDKHTHTLPWCICTHTHTNTGLGSQLGLSLIDSLYQKAKSKYRRPVDLDVFWEILDSLVAEAFPPGLNFFQKFLKVPTGTSAKFL